MQNKFKKKKKINEDMSLQITSMADIFTILLVFLLKSYSSSVSVLTPVANTKLPQAVTKGQDVRDTLKMEISRVSVLIDEKPVIKLNGYRLPPGQLSASGQVDTVFNVLSAQRKHMPHPNLDQNLLVLADENTPYATIKPLLASAARAGFTDLQLVAVSKEE